MITALLALVVFGVILYLVENYIPMSEPIKVVVRVIVVIILIIFLLRAFGFVDIPLNLR